MKAVGRHDIQQNDTLKTWKNDYIFGRMTLQTWQKAMLQNDTLHNRMPLIRMLFNRLTFGRIRLIRTTLQN